MASTCSSPLAAAPSPINTVIIDGEEVPVIMTGPLSPASQSQGSRGVLSPQSTRSSYVGTMDHEEEEEGMAADFSCAMFSPKKYGEVDASHHDDHGDVLSDSEPMSPKSPCSCADDSVPVEAEAMVSPHTPNSPADVGDNNDARVSPANSAKSILVDSEDERETTEEEDANDEGKVEKKKKKGKRKKKAKKVAFVEKNPTPLSPPMSPMSYGTHNSSVVYDQHESMLSPRNDDEETLSLEDMSDYDDDSSHDTGSKKKSLLSKANNRKLGINTPTPKNSQSLPKHVEVIPDDDSEASIMVLMRYMGCTPVAYGEGARKPSSAQTTTPTGREFVFDTFDEDDNSLLSDEEYVMEEDVSTIASCGGHHEQEQEIHTSWTMKNEEVGVEMGLDDLVDLQSPPELEKKKTKKTNLTVDTKADKKKKNKTKTMSPGMETLLSMTRSPHNLSSPGMASLQSMASPAHSSTLATSPGGAMGSSIAAASPGFTDADDLVSHIKKLQLPKSPGAAAVAVAETGDGILSDSDLKDFLEGKAVDAKKMKKLKKKKKASTAPVVLVPATDAEVRAQEQIARIKERAAKAIEMAAETRAGTPRASTFKLEESNDTGIKALSVKKSTSSESSKKKKKKKKTKAKKADAAAVKPSPQVSDSGDQQQQKQLASRASAESQPPSEAEASVAEAPSDEKMPLEEVKLEKSPSTRSDKENGSIEASSNKRPLSIDTGASSVANAIVGQVSPGTSKSVKEVDELLSKTREWLVRHSEAQLSKKRPSTTTASSVAAKQLLSTKQSTSSPTSPVERKVMGNITSQTLLENATKLTTPSAAGTPRSLAESLLKSKGISIKAGARESSPSSLLSSATSPTNSTSGPKKSIMEQLNEIRAKQQELEQRHKNKSAATAVA